jgi:tRNA-specific 2-thiouridylase
VIDHESQFREEVVERFADEYLAGRTPIPCIRCNMGPKFTDLFAMARELGADCLATGHYVRRVIGPAGLNCTARSIQRATRATSFTAPPKRSSNFLRFPLGGLPKSEVRAIAEAEGLRVAAKPDSQDICFVPDGDYAKIVRSVRPEGGAPGEIVHATTGEVLGTHQRHHPLYRWSTPRAGDRRSARAALCHRIDAPERRVLVGPKILLAVGAARIVETNRIGPLPDGPLTAKVRSLAKPVPVALEGSLGGGADCTIRFAQPEYGVAPGQAAVLYSGDRVVGGGWIDSTEGV